MDFVAIDFETANIKLYKRMQSWYMCGGKQQDN